MRVQIIFLNVIKQKKCYKSKVAAKKALDAEPIKALIIGALTDKIDDREIFMKGIDYSY